MHIEVDEGRCVGAGNCVLTAPEVFDQRDEDGIAVVLDRTAGRQDDVRRAVDLCPAAAITVHS